MHVARDEGDPDRLVVVCLQGMRRRLARCRTRYGSGARGQSGLYSCVTKVSCALSRELLSEMRHFTYPCFRGSIGAWIKHVAAGTPGSVP